MSSEIKAFILFNLDKEIELVTKYIGEKIPSFKVNLDTYLFYLNKFYIEEARFCEAIERDSNRFIALSDYHHTFAMKYDYSCKMYFNNPDSSEKENYLGMSRLCFMLSLNDCSSRNDVIKIKRLMDFHFKLIDLNGQ